jgi:hypothetical protein
MARRPRQRGVHHLALTRAPQLVLLEQVTDVVKWGAHGTLDDCLLMGPRRLKLHPIQPGNLHGVPDFLCESCGYNLTSSEEGSRCPECGKPVADSLPSSHPGTPWQQRPGLFSWARTCWNTLFRPGETFQSVSTARIPRGFLALNILLASALFAAPFTGVFIDDWARAARGKGAAIESLAYLSAYGVQTLLVASLLLALTIFDVYGITLLGRTKGWRLTSRTAWIVCAHASAGWLVAAILPLLLMANYYVLGTLVKIDFTGPVTRVQGQPPWTWQTVLGIGFPLLGALCGLIVFELVALKGARTCRFANPPGARPAHLPA